MRLINADALMEYCSNQKTKTISNNDIARFPTVPYVADLVRCKDCKHRETDDCPMYWVEWSIFEDCDGYADDKYIVHDYTTDDGYCNYGERK